MFKLRIVTDFDDGQLQRVDGIPITTALLDEAKHLAENTGKIIFVGAMARQIRIRPENIHDVVSALMDPFAFRPTGEWVISDDRDEVLKHGCAGLIGVLPTPKAVA